MSSQRFFDALKQLECAVCGERIKGWTHYYDVLRDGHEFWFRCHGQVELTKMSNAEFAFYTQTANHGALKLGRCFEKAGALPLLGSSDNLPTKCDT